MGRRAVRALRTVLAVVLAGAVLVQAPMVWAAGRRERPRGRLAPADPDAREHDPGHRDGQVALVCVWRLVTTVRRGTVSSHAAFRYVDVVIGAIVGAAVGWFAVTP